MPARMVVSAGPAAGQEFAIEEEVVRLGSDPRCHIRLEASAHMPPHLATLEYRDGRYFVYNRSDRPIVLAGQPLPKNASAPWANGQDLLVGPDVILRLVADANPAPLRTPPSRIRPDQIAAADAEPIAPVTAPPAGPAPLASGKWLQVVITLICFGLAVALLLMEEPSTPAGPPRDARDEFSKALTELQAFEGSNTGKPTSLSQELQTARSLRLRRDPRGDELYRRLRERILMRYPDGKPMPPAVEQTLAFVTAELRSPVSPRAATEAEK